MLNNLLHISIIKFIRKKYSFFLVNTIGWILFWLFSQMVILSSSAATIRDTLGNLIAYISGYLTTFILWYFYKKLVPARLSEVIPWIYISVLCIVHAHIWIAIDFVIFGLTMYDFWDLVEWFNLTYYLRALMHDLIRLLAWSLIYFIIKIRVEWKDITERQMKSELNSKNLEIQMLRYQLNPHFLFNSLNSIRALVLKDAHRSREMISELSEFLRYTLISKNHKKISLKEEIEAVKHFCRIEKIRYQDNLEISFSIEANTENIMIPPLILHPLVENAIKFGMETTQNLLTIELNSYLETDRLILEITNTGQWINKEERNQHPIEGTNTGLENVRQILENCYPDNHKFEIATDLKKVIIRITINTGRND